MDKPNEKKEKQKRQKKREENKERKTGNKEKEIPADSAV